MAVEDDSEKLNESFTISRKISQKSSERTPIPLQAQGSCLSFLLREKMVAKARKIVRTWRRVLLLDWLE